MRILVTGNCQRLGIATAVRHLIPSAIVEVFGTKSRYSNTQLAALLARLPTFDLVITQYPPTRFRIGSQEYAPHSNQIIVQIPPFVFTGFHPDMIYVKTIESGFLGPFTDYSSRLTLFGLFSGFSVAQTETLLFNPSTYDLMGWHFDTALNALYNVLDRAKLDIRPLVSEWLRYGCFMNTINHPKLRPLCDITRLALEPLRLSLRPGNAADFAPDPNWDEVWPILPGLPIPLTVPAGSPLFRLTGLSRAKPDSNALALITLHEYIDMVFRELSEIKLESVCFEEFNEMRDRLSSVRSRDYSERGKASAHKNPKPIKNPYSELPDFHFWKKAVASVPYRSINPMVAPPFYITRDDRIAAAGSCFAQHISRRLSRSGFNYFVAEAAPPGMPENEAAESSYGIFSARYGNIYTTRQLRQLFDRAFGQFNPVDEVWRSRDTGFLDPFRPGIEQKRTLSEQEVILTRIDHLAAVQRLFREANVLVFTLGLTEAWRSKRDGAVFPLAPGVVAAVESPSDYEFINFSFEETREDLLYVVDKVRSINPIMKFILTVSPVPLIATYEKRHVLISTTASKSLLRAVADEVSRLRESIMYFPSYEIITMSASMGRYFDRDLRTVTEEGVDHVMDVFFSSCTRKNPGAGASSGLAAEIQAISEVICDEERIADSVA